MFSKICIKLILLVCGVMLVHGYAYPLSKIGTDSADQGESVSVQLLTRALEEDSDIVLSTALLDNKASSDKEYDENPNDLELAEVNIFKPLFRYRVSVAKRVRAPPQFK